MSQPQLRKPAFVSLGLFLASVAVADTVITLRKSFVDEYQSKAVIAASIVPTHPSPIKSVSTGAKDGDVHIAAILDSSIGLPMVAEITNAKNQKPVVNTIKAAAAAGDALNVEGVWRIWCEHGGDNVFVQGADVETPENSNPDHVFELHPLTKVGDISLAATSFKPITGYSYKDPEDSFQRFENAPSEISEAACADGQGRCVTVRTKMVGFNYTAFLIQLEKDAEDMIREANDSTWVFSRVFGLDGEKVVGGQSNSPTGTTGRRKMVFIKGTPPHDLLATMKKGDVLKVVGIPRLNLTLVKYRVEHQDQFPGSTNWNLPYEMIILSASKSTVDVE